MSARTDTPPSPQPKGDPPATRFRSVACWVDTVDPSVARAVVAEASRWLPRSGEGRLVVGHVDSWLPPLRSRDSVWQRDRPHLFEQVREYLATLCAEVPRAESVLLSSPDPPAEAAAWAAKEDVDLLVVAAHNSPLTRMGSFAGPLVALAACPVLVVPTPLVSADAPDRDARGAPTHIACCVDESSAADAAIETARTLAAETGARLTLLHGVVQARPLRMLGLSRLLPAPRRRERPVVARLAERANTVPGAAFVVVDGRPRDICGWADEHDVDLIVAGAGHHPTGIRLPGSFAHEVAVNASCPVMLVPADGRSAPDHPDESPKDATLPAPEEGT